MFQIMLQTEPERFDVQLGEVGYAQGEPSTITHCTIQFPRWEHEEPVDVDWVLTDQQRWSTMLDDDVQQDAIMRTPARVLNAMSFLANLIDGDFISPSLKEEA